MVLLKEPNPLSDIDHGGKTPRTLEKIGEICEGSQKEP